MKKSNIKSNLLFALFIVLSVLLTRWSINFGMDRAMTGKETLIWLHVIAFFVSIGLVLLAIILKTKFKE